MHSSLLLQVLLLSDFCPDLASPLAVQTLLRHRCALHLLFSGNPKRQRAKGPTGKPSSGTVCHKKELARNPWSLVLLLLLSCQRAGLVVMRIADVAPLPFILMPRAFSRSSYSACLDSDAEHMQPSVLSPPWLTDTAVVSTLLHAYHSSIRACALA